MINNLRKSEQSMWWRASLILTLTFVLTLSAISCDKDDNASLDEYYVKYEVNSSTIYSGGKLDLTIRTENNENLTLEINQRILHETIVGPVKEGFNASMDVVAQGNTYDKLKLYTNIYVSKNGSPFALKNSDGSDEFRDYVQLNYTIDY